MLTYQRMIHPWNWSRGCATRNGEFPGWCGYNYLVLPLVKYPHYQMTADWAATKRMIEGMSS